MPKKRKTIPEETEASVFAANRHLCCICHKEGRAVQTHHIDDDPSNNDPKNLCVLCLHHHDEVHGKPGLGKGYTVKELKIYKKEWEDRCKVEGSKKNIINNIFLFSRDLPALNEFTALRNLVALGSTGATTAEVLQSVNKATGFVEEATGDKTIAENFRVSVLKRHELEVQSSLNAIYGAAFGEGEGKSPLLVKDIPHGPLYRITLKSNGESESISVDLVNEYIDGSLKDAEAARGEIIEIFEKLRDPRFKEQEAPK